MNAINTIVNADCLAALPEIQAESINMVLTDPPYITRYKSRDGQTVQNDDNDAWLKPAFAEMYRVLERNAYCISFYGWPQVDKFVDAYRAAGFRVVGHLVFLKRYPSSTRHLKYQHECAHLLAKGYPREPRNTISDVLDFQYTGNKLHPTQKPLNAMLPLVETFSRSGAVVLDPFCGSGTNLLAAKLMGRDYIGVEIDSAHHATACKRLEGNL